MIQGLNHVTLAVRDLAQSLLFYTEVLGCQQVATWPCGAYLLAGDLWLAFSVAEVEFALVSARIRNSGAQIWQENRSEGASLYFLDPNGHKLEIHLGSLREQLQAARLNPWPGLEITLDSENTKEPEK